ncbi:MAG: flagellar basal body rod protein FlgC [Myxococcales bacterium]|nr:flagellar basal body rod protein FlgC [Myxococcales bacterium]MDD9968310.1 flagellar basal body rod protein FlgC [Myxococcales bacterium]
MNLFSAMEIASSGLSAQRQRLNALSSNLANARTTRTPEGGPYKRLDPIFQAVPVATRFSDLVNEKAAQAAHVVTVPEIRQDQAPPQTLYDPNHPDANEEGFIQLPNVNVVQEMVNLITASRSYEAGVNVMKTLGGMARSALTIGS